MKGRWLLALQLSLPRGGGGQWYATTVRGTGPGSDHGGTPRTQLLAMRAAVGRGELCLVRCGGQVRYRSRLGFVGGFTAFELRLCLCAILGLNQFIQFASLDGMTRANSGSTCGDTGQCSGTMRNLKEC